MSPNAPEIGAGQSRSAKVHRLSPPPLSGKLGADIDAMMKRQLDYVRRSLS
jgi:hypothetical protein